MPLPGTRVTAKGYLLLIFLSLLSVGVYYLSQLDMVNGPWKATALFILVLLFGARMFLRDYMWYD